MAIGMTIAKIIGMEASPTIDSIIVPLAILTLSVVIVDLHHKENLLTRKEIEETFRFQHQMNWHKVLPSKDATKVARIADIMDKHGLEEDVREIRG